MKNALLLCLSVLMIGTVRQSSANPVGGTVVGGDGNATISGSGTSVTTINQHGNRVIIDWRDFSIGLGEITRFIQPSSTSIALNRVGSANPSLLYGSLQANGRVIVINRNGIMVGPQGTIDTKGFVASTRDVPNANFMSGGPLNFSGDSSAGVRNEGTIRALGGNVFLIGNTVENAGTISAPQGTVGMAAGSEVRLMQSGHDRLSVLAGTSGTGATIGVDNSGSIQAAAAELKAAGGNIYALAINNGGIVRANGIVNENGHIYLRASGGNIQNSGTLSANNADGSGGTVILDGGHNAGNASTVTSSGTIEATGTAGTRGGTVQVLGDHVGLFDHASIDASGDSGGGTVLVGGDYHGGNPNIQNAQATYVGNDTHINADAVRSGNGGKVVLWADDVTRFGGSISARGGAHGGNGGFVETSGRVSLEYRGDVDLRANVGSRRGTLLLDPSDLTITDTAAGTGSLDGSLPNVFASINPTTAETISRGSLEAQSASANIILEANNNITINNISGNILNLAADSSGSITFTADADHNGVGNFSMNTGDTIRTHGGAVSISGIGLTVGTITTTFGGASGGAVNLHGDTISFGTINAGAGNITLAPETAGTAISLGTTGGGLHFANADLSGANTTGILIIGSPTAGPLSVTSALTQGSKNMQLDSGSTVSFAASGTLTTTGDVTVDAGGGIPGDNGGVAHIVANNITLNSTGGNIGTDAGNPFSVNASGTLNGNSANTGDIFVSDTAGNLTVGSIDAGSHNVNLSSAGSILDDGNNATVIHANALTLTAATSIGASGANNEIDTDVTSLTAQANNGSIFLGEQDTLTADGLTITSATASGANHDVNISAAAGNLLVGVVTATRNISLSALAGAINDDVNDSSADVIANTVSLNSSAGIGQGAGGSLDVNANTISQADTLTGGIAVNLLNDAAAGLAANHAVNVAESQAATSGDIVFTGTAGTGTRTFTSVTTGNGNINVSSTSGDILLGQLDASGTAGKSVTVTATGGAINDSANDAVANILADSASLTASTGIGQGANGSVDVNVNTVSKADTATGGVALNLLNDAAGGLAANHAVTVTEAKATTSGDIVLTGTAGSGTRTYGSVQTANGNINVSAAAGDLALGLLDASGTAGKSVTVTATSGAITDDVNDNAADVIGGSVSLTASTGIGQGANGSVDVNVSTVTKADSDNGGVALNVLNDAAGGLAANHAVTITEAKAITSGDVVLTGTTGSGTRTYASVVTGNGNIDISAAAGDISLGLLNTSATAGKTVTVTATGGGITDSANDAVANILADSVSLTANTGIGQGANGSVDVNVNTVTKADSATGGVAVNLLNDAAGGLAANHAVTVLEAKATTSGDVVLTGTAGSGARTYDSVVAANGNINVSSANGNLVLGLLDASGTAGKSVTVTATGGSITDDANDALADVLADSVSLTASTGIGQGANGSIDVNVNTVTKADSATAGVALDLLNDAAGGLAANHAVTVAESSATTSGDIVFTGTAGTGSRTFTSVSTANGNINISAVSGNLVANGLDTSATAGKNVTLTLGDGVATAVGTISQSGGTGIKTGTLTVKTLDDTAGANISLNNAANHVGNADLETLNAAGTLAQNASIAYADAGGFSVSSVNTLGNASLRAGGTVSQTGAILAAGLELLGSGTFNLNLTSGGVAVNDVAKIAANLTGGGSINYRDMNDVTVDTVNGTSGITTSGGGVNLTADTSNIVLNKDVNAGAGNIGLTATAGAVTENAGAKIIANGLAVVAQNSSSLAQSGNNVTLLAANITGAGSTFSFEDANAVQVDSVTAGPNPTVTGITTVGGDVSVKADAGNVVVNKDINVGSANVGLIAAAGAVNEISGAKVIANGLAVTAQNSSTLTSAGNDVTTIAAHMTGAGGGFNYLDANDLQVGSVSVTGNPVVNGITTANGNVQVSAANNLNTTADISTAGGAVALNANNISLGGNIISGSGNVTATAANTLDTAGNINSGGGGVTLNAATMDLGGNITSGSGTVTATALNTLTLNAVGNISSGSGNVDLTAAAIDLGGNVSAANGNVAIITDTLNIGGTISAGGDINAGKGRVTLAEKSATRAISLGTELADSLSLTETELNHVTAGVLQIGDSALKSGDITINASISPLNTSTLSLRSGAGIKELSGKTITISSLSVQTKAGPGITVNLHQLNNIQHFSAAGHPVDLQVLGLVNLGKKVDGIGDGPNTLPGGTSAFVPAGSLIAQNGAINGFTAQNTALAAALASAFIPQLKLDTADYTGAQVSVDEAARLLPPGAIGTLWLQVPLIPNPDERYKVENISKWTSGRVAASGSTAGPQTPK